MRPDLYHFLRRATAQVRWATLAGLLAITLLWAVPAAGGVPVWMLVLLFAGYNLLVGLGLKLPVGLRAFELVAVLDLLVGGVLYLLAAEFGGLLFVLFFFAVDSAAAVLTLRGTLLYTTAVALVAATIDLSLRSWSPTTDDLRMIAARLIMLALVGAGMALLTRRLTLEHQLARLSRDEAERLEALDRFRADFLATVSHDLRTPLTATRTALRLVEASAADRLRADERALLENGHRNIKRLDLLIGDLLAVNQLIAGTLRLDREPLDLRAVVAEALATVEPLLREKGQPVTVDLPEPLRSEGDSWRLQQVLVNLLANAHRHTPVGTQITIGGRATAGEVCLSVSDNGPGIPAEDQQAIFRRFHRLAPSSGSVDGGAGLGLAIAKELIDLHGGRLWLESAPGHGSAFQIALPRYA